MGVPKLELLEQQRKRILGMEHSHTIRAAVNFAVTHTRQGRWEEAELLLFPAVTRLWDCIILTQDTINRMVFVFGELRKWDEVENE